MVIHQNGAGELLPKVFEGQVTVFLSPLRATMGLALRPSPSRSSSSHAIPAETNGNSSLTIYIAAIPVFSAAGILVNSQRITVRLTGMAINVLNPMNGSMPINEGLQFNGEIFNQERTWITQFHIHRDACVLRIPDGQFQPNESCSSEKAE